MTCLLAIDPGRRNLGWALFLNGALEDCGVVREKDADLAQTALRFASSLQQGPIHRLVVEQMRVYPGPQQKGDQNDLLDLAFVGGVAVGALAGPETEVQLVPAREWKGNVPKDVVHKRVRGVLGIVEFGVLETALKSVPKSLQHNALDAVGIGLWALRRLTRGGVDGC